MGGVNGCCRSGTFSSKSRLKFSSDPHQIIPFLHSKSFETRTGASVALSHIFSLTPLWRPNVIEDDKSGAQISLPEPEYPKFSVEELVAQGKLLLASSGKEFLKPSGILSSAAEVKKARKEAMGRLGLDFLDNVADEIDLDKELADEDGDVEMEAPPASGSSKSDTLAPPSPMDVCVPSPTSDSRSGSATPGAEGTAETDLANMSARERNRLKRKRKPGNTAFVAAPPPQSAGAKYSAAPGNSSAKWVSFQLLSKIHKKLTLSQELV